MITGATDGLGRAVAGRLPEREDVTLFLHGRSGEKLDDLAAELRDSAATIDILPPPVFSQLAQVHALADAIASRTARLSVLVRAAQSFQPRLTCRSTALPMGVSTTGEGQARVVGSEASVTTSN